MTRNPTISDVQVQYDSSATGPETLELIFNLWELFGRIDHSDCDLTCDEPTDSVSSDGSECE